VESIRNLAELAITLAGLACLIAALRPWVPRLPASLSPDPTHDRLANLDGLRAFLAIGVLLSHAWTLHDRYFRGTPWGWPKNPYFSLSGGCAVPAFFMITSFLFWGKARAAGGLSAFRLYSNRARRILPLYYSVCLLGIAIALVVGGPWQGGLPVILREILLRVIPGYRPVAAMGGFPNMLPLLGATWTLFFESCFYLALPALALLAKGRKPYLLLALSAACIAVRRVLSHNNEYWLDSFWVGVLVCEVRMRMPGIAPAMSSRAAGLLILAGALVWPLVSGAYMGLATMALVSAAFAAVVFGNSLLGILVLPGARVLGTASYSIYLLHLPVLFILLRLLDRVTPVARIPGPGFAALTIVLMGVVCSLSLASFAWIEAPWIRRGKSAARAGTGKSAPVRILGAD
jgi:peptidoglycan/LPS O-acetylase OafA/YrhL